VSGNADSSLSGLKVACPKCSTIFLVPHPGTTLSSPRVSDAEHVKEADTNAAHPFADEVVEQGGAVDGTGGPGYHSVKESTIRNDPFLPDHNEQAEKQVHQQEVTTDRAADTDLETGPSSGDVGGGDSCPVQDQPQAAEAVEEELRAELEDMLAGTCTVCGKAVDEKSEDGGSGAVYCHNCLGNDFDRQELNDAGFEKAAVSAGSKYSSEGASGANIRRFSLPDDISAVALIKESWAMTKGVKGSLWAGIVVMFLVLFALGAGAVYIRSHWGGRAGFIWNLLSQLIGTVLSIIFLSGLINIGIRRVSSQPFSWTLVFSGFLRLGSILLAGLLMSLLIVSGFFLFVLPGIYLAVGYSLALPLIMDRGAGPWKAMEMSRQAIHDKWWQVFAAYLLMYLLYILSMIPFGIGMIWTVPMFFMLTAVIYRVLFGQNAE